MILSAAQLYYGRPKNHQPILQLKAGPLTMIFDPEIGFLRHIRLGDHEVIRAIYGAIRDQNWATAPSQIANLQSEIKPDSFVLSFDVTCRMNNIHYFWKGKVTGSNDGTVTYNFDGEARSEFLRNRIGLCVLHPILECAGQVCRVTHVNGKTEEGRFPKSISPVQPFFDIGGLAYPVANTGITAEISFAGEAFEMEDQRNWADASFKTYSTPQVIAKPVQIKTGDRVNHTVTLKLSGNVRPILPVIIGRPPQISIATTPVLTMPPLGLCASAHETPLAQKEAQRLKTLRLSHLRVDLPLASEDYPRRLEAAAKEAVQCGAALHVALMLSDNAERELQGLLEHLQRIKPPVSLWLIFHRKEISTRANWVRLAQKTLQNYAPNVLLAAGTKEFYMDINGERPEPGGAPLLCYALTPQVHQPDNLTIVENLSGLAYTVESARELSPGQVVPSPITLRPYTPFRETAGMAGGALPPDVDPRQMSLLGAGWTLGSIGRLASTGNVHSLTYFQTTGWRGIMERETGSSSPDFPGLPGSVFPVYHVFADIAEFSGRTLFPTISSHPLQVEGLTLSDGKRRRILLANLTEEPQEVKIKTGTATGKVRYLDERNAVQAMTEPESFRQGAGERAEAVTGKIAVNLLPFGLATLDI